jgi:NAD(P)-dependent dehydrogenase (short-subunit alcohol dehydrogenase family)
MQASGGGWLLSTASAAGLMSQFDAPYAVTRHAAVAYAEWLAIMHGGDGIGVSCLCAAQGGGPGAVDPRNATGAADLISAKV